MLTVLNRISTSSFLYVAQDFGKDANGDIHIRAHHAILEGHAVAILAGHFAWSHEMWDCGRQLRV